MTKFNYSEVSLEQVARFFGEHYEPKDGEQIISVEVVAVDPARDKVVYRIHTTAKGADA